MKIAIIGSGISGLVCAHLLYKDFDLSIFEANDYIGGHTHTIDVTRADGSYAVDSGFIVFNRTTYPNFCRLLQQLGVDSKPTRMNFSVRCEKTGLEYGSASASTLFAQRRNILSPSYWRMVLDIFRLRRTLTAYINSRVNSSGCTTFRRDLSSTSLFPSAPPYGPQSLVKFKNFQPAPLAVFLKITAFCRRQTR